MPPLGHVPQLGLVVLPGRQLAFSKDHMAIGRIFLGNVLSEEDSRRVTPP